MKTHIRYILLITVIVMVIGSIIYLDQGRIDTSVINEEAAIADIDISETKDMMYEKAKEIVRPSGYLNTEEINISDLIGEKVIMLDFMTYSCINCQRTYPYLNAWWEKYQDKGLQIIGLHTPEFEFEKDIENVRDAAQRFGLEFPLVLDNDYGTWRAYGNRYWPRKYIIDIDGYIVYDHIGEGDYEETEDKIRELLEERADKLGEEIELDDTYVDPEGVIETGRAINKSPEIYFGSLRNDLIQTDSPPNEPNTHQLYLAGSWGIQPEYAQSEMENSRVIFRYRADKVYFVASADEPVEVTVYRDGEEINKFTVKEEQLYTVIDNPEGFGEYTLEIVGDKPGLQIYTFTFG